MFYSLKLNIWFKVQVSEAHTNVEQESYKAHYPTLVPHLGVIIPQQKITKQGIITYLNDH
jgi:hypothetical protein